MKTFKVPFELLEEKYWKEAGFCLSCGEFSSEKVKPSFPHECPLCQEESFYPVDYLMKREVLVSVD